jgi:hypothetical protein
MNMGRLQVMNENDVQLLLDLGIVDPRADEYSAWTAWYKFLDELGGPVGDRARALGPQPTPGCQDPSHPNYAEYFGDDRVQKLVNQMTPAEKIELRDRTLAACGNKRGGR